MKSWLEKNCIEMYSIHNGRKFAVAERLIRTLKKNFYKYIYKNVYIEKFNKYNDTYLRTIKKWWKIKHIYVISDLKGKEIVGTFYQKNGKKTNQKEFKVEKVIERKGVKLYVKWKGYDSSFNSCIDKKGKWVNIFHKRN